MALSSGTSSVAAYAGLTSTSAGLQYDGANQLGNGYWWNSRKDTVGKITSWLRDATISNAKYSLKFYDLAGHLIEDNTPGDLNQDWQLQTVRHVYDNLGREVETDRGSVGDFGVNASSWNSEYQKYDRMNHQVEHDDAIGYTKSSYDEMGHRTSFTRQVDGNGAKVVTDYTLDGEGHVLTKKVENGASPIFGNYVNYAYDGWGNKLTEVNTGIGETSDIVGGDVSLDSAISQAFTNNASLALSVRVTMDASAVTDSHGIKASLRGNPASTFDWLTGAAELGVARLGLHAFAGAAAGGLEMMAHPVRTASSIGDLAELAWDHPDAAWAGVKSGAAKYWTEPWQQKVVDTLEIGAPTAEGIGALSRLARSVMFPAALEANPRRVTTEKLAEFERQVGGGYMPEKSYRDLDVSNKVSISAAAIVPDLVSASYQVLPSPGTFGKKIYIQGLLDRSVLEFSVDASNRNLVAAGGNGPELFRSMVRAYAKNGYAIEGINGFWTHSMPTNRNQYFDGLRAGMAPEQAALNTFTGQRAQELGFTRVDNVFGESSYKPYLNDDVMPRFRRPNESEYANWVLKDTDSSSLSAWTTYGNAFASSNVQYLKRMGSSEALKQAWRNLSYFPI